MTPAERARSVLRSLDHEVQIADREMDNCHEQAKATATRFQASLARIRAIQDPKTYREALADAGVVSIEEHEARAEEAAQRWRWHIAEAAQRYGRRMAEYEGARYMAVELGVIRFDERPMWTATGTP